MHNRTLTVLASLLIAGPLSAQIFEDLPPKPQKASFGEVKFCGGNLTANRKTGETVATGDVKIQSGDFHLHSSKVTKSADGVYDSGDDALFTTCSNHMDNLHWKATGHITYNAGSEDSSSGRYIKGTDIWLYLMDIPVLWVPWFYYPLDTNYGFRLLPGYTSSWRAYLLSGYVYDIYNEKGTSPIGLGGSTYLNLRQRNGVEIGQTVRWRLSDHSQGKIKGFYAWDDHYDKYTQPNPKYNYHNWGSAVERERYRLMFKHRTDFSERDTLSAEAIYLSDSYLIRDFCRRPFQRSDSVPANEVWYEHLENTWASGVTVSGPLNEFYGGTAKLPEAWIAVEPQAIFDLPANYESQTRAGFLNRQYAEKASPKPMFHYDPYIGETGKGADYQAFRADSSHRVSSPFLIEDVLSVVPRAGYHATWWSDSGDPDSNWEHASGDALYRGIAEIGATVSARAHSWINENWQHVFEPYLDYSFQEANFGSDDGNRNYIFDNYDGSVDWLDQFGFEGRGLPYSWHGIRPGIRNYLRKKNDNNTFDDLLAADLYAAIPFLDESYRSAGDFLSGYPQNREDGFHNRHDCVTPGFMVRFTPSNRFAFKSRTEFDLENEKVAYSDIETDYVVSHDFKWKFGYLARDHRIWDYLPSNYNRWNYHYTSLLYCGFEHEVCDWFAWSPYLRWDARYNEHDEMGAWFDFLTDCLGFRFSLMYINSFRRVDGSKRDSDVEISFSIYLRTLGPQTSLMSDLL